MIGVNFVANKKLNRKKSFFGSVFTLIIQINYINFAPLNPTLINGTL
jgi:hypothetical protein